MGKLIGMNPSTQGKQSIDIKKSKAIKCAKCDCEVFMPAMKFRKISKLLTGTAKDAIIPIEVYCCSDCGEICEELLPDQLKNLK